MPKGQYDRDTTVYQVGDLNHPDKHDPQVEGYDAAADEAERQYCHEWPIAIWRLQDSYLEAIYFDGRWYTP